MYELDYEEGSHDVTPRYLYEEGDVYGYDEDLFCVNCDDAGIWHNNSRFTEAWNRVGDRCKQLHVCDGGLFCVNNENSSIWKRDRGGGWSQVGESAGVVYGASGWQHWKRDY